MVWWLRVGGVEVGGCIGNWITMTRSRSCKAVLYYGDEDNRARVRNRGSYTTGAWSNSIAQKLPYKYVS